MYIYQSNGYYSMFNHYQNWCGIESTPTCLVAVKADDDSGAKGFIL